MNPIKVFKYCPRCGSMEFISDSFKSLKCNKCGLHFFVNSSAAVAALITNDKNELLFTVRAFEPCKGMLDLPGGFVDPGETVEDSLYREIKEELNLDIQEVSYFSSFPNEYLFSGLTVFTIDLAMICKVTDFSTIRSADDVADFIFISPDNIDYSRIGGDSIRKIVKRFVQNN